MAGDTNFCPILKWTVIIMSIWHTFFYLQIMGK